MKVVFGRTMIASRNKKHFIKVVFCGIMVAATIKVKSKGSLYISISDNGWTKIIKDKDLQVI